VPRVPAGAGRQSAAKPYGKAATLPHADTGDEEPHRMVLGGHARRDTQLLLTKKTA